MLLLPQANTHFLYDQHNRPHKASSHVRSGQGGARPPVSHWRDPAPSDPVQSFRPPPPPPPPLAPAISESSGPEWGGGGRGKGRAEGVGDVWKCTSEEGNGGKDLRGRGTGGIVGEFR